MESDHPIFGNWDIWGWVYGIPLSAGAVAAVLGYHEIAVLCIGGVFGSFAIICVLHAITSR